MSKVDTTGFYDLKEDEQYYQFEVRKIYGENTLFYPQDAKDLCIDLVNNYELWVDKDGGTIEISVVGENSILKSETFSIKLDN